MRSKLFGVGPGSFLASFASDEAAARMADFTFANEAEVMHLAKSLCKVLSSVCHRLCSGALYGLQKENNCACRARQLPNLHLRTMTLLCLPSPHKRLSAKPKQSCEIVFDRLLRQSQNGKSVGGWLEPAGAGEWGTLAKQPRPQSIQTVKLRAIWPGWDCAIWQRGCCWLAGLFGCLFVALGVDGWVGGSVGWSVGWLVGWLVGWVGGVFLLGGLWVGYELWVWVWFGFWLCSGCGGCLYSY